MRNSVVMRYVAGVCCLLPLPVLAASGWDMTPGVTDISNQVFSLHRTILYICIAIGLVVFGMMFWSILHHRKSKGAVAANFHESTTVEIIWTVIPFLILIGMAIPATKVLIAMDDASESELTVRVTGSQWKWHYEYLTYADDKDVAGFVLRGLKEAGHVVEHADNGRDGLFLAASENFDAVILDSIVVGGNCGSRAGSRIAKLALGSEQLLDEDFEDLELRRDDCVLVGVCEQR